MSESRNLAHYPFVLPELKFSYADLEPLMDARTVEIHHSKHHAGYVKNLNAALKDHPDFHSWTIEEILRNLQKLPGAIRKTVKNNGGGHANHTFFWEILKPAPSPKCPPLLAHAAETSFGSLAGLKTEFGQAVLGVFGSGWVFLVSDPKQGGKLRILSLPNHESVLSLGLPGLLICDVWEHAYYLKHQNRRGDFFECYWKLVDWEAVNRRFEDAQAQKTELQKVG